jgi:PAS domain S-box-containing protein
MLIFKPIVQYINQHREIESRLLQNEQRLKYFYESGLIGVYYWNKEGIITEANKKFLELTCYSEEDLKMEKILWANLSPGEFAINDEVTFKKMMQSKLTKPFRRQFITKEGNRIWVETAVAVLDREKINGVAFILDITERKAAEKLRRNYRRSLEKMVKERTIQLEEAKFKAEKSDKLKTAFLSNLSHEIRTPLNSIIGFSGILLMEKAGNLKDEQKKQLDMVKTSANHLLRIINDILDLSEIEANDLKLDLEVFDFYEIVQSLVKEQKPAADQKGLELIIETNSEEIRVYSDKTRIFQIISALVNNAIKFTEKGMVKIIIQKGAGEFKFIVCDTGIGIKPKQMEKLFQPFIRIEDAHHRKYEGSGLGLAVSKRLTEVLNGKLEVTSTFGQGSTFCCSFPIAAKDAIS